MKLSTTAVATSFFPFVLVFAVILAGCLTQQKPFTFTSAASPGGAIDAAARTLAASGYPVGNVDRQTGIVSSKWTTFGAPSTDGSVAVKRFTVTIAPTGAESTVALRMDVQTCPPGGYNAGEMQVLGTCSVIDGLFPGGQAEVDEMGAKLRTALAQPVTTAASTVK